MHHADLQLSLWMKQINWLLANATHPTTKISRADATLLAGAAVVAASNGPNRTALYDRITVGRKDATSAAAGAAGCPAPPTPWRSSAASSRLRASPTARWWPCWARTRWA